MTHVLVVGAGGFIGRHVVHRLLAGGHAVTCAGRDVASLQRRNPTCRVVAADVGRDDTTAWCDRLDGIDAVVNAAGMMTGDLDAVHRRGAIALFDACAAVGTGRVIQISALGAGVQPTAFLATKAAADTHLIGLARSGGRAWCVLRPSIVIGPGGRSTALFSALASLPRPVGLGPGTWAIQPVHVHDLARAVVDLLTRPTMPQVLDLVGPAAISTDALTLGLRSWLGLPARRIVHLPASLLRAGAAVGQLMPGATLTPDSLAMLAAGNTADPAPARQALGWAPRPFDAALADCPATEADRLAARLLPVRPALIGGLAAIWIGTGIVSLLLTAAQRNTLLAPLGLVGWGADAATLAGAVLDLVLGLALFSRRVRGPALLAQLAVVLGYTALASMALPGLWLDPFGPLLKNLGVVAASLALLAMEGS